MRCFEFPWTLKNDSKAVDAVYCVSIGILFTGTNTVSFLLV